MYARLVDFVIGNVIQLKFLDGYRLYAGGAFMLLTGLGILANEFATGVYDHDSFEKGLALIGAGIGAVGAAGKADKIIAAAKGE